jgi:hypothetical protein
LENQTWGAPVLIFKNAVFLHVPKTGGIWVRSAVTNASIEFEEYIVDGDVHGDLSYCPFSDRFVFAFVREPLSLYRSYWRYKMGAGWDRRNPFDVECQMATFEGFVANVLSLEPAWCSRMFEDYVGPRTAEIDFIGRYESLADDLVRALHAAGETFDEAAIRNTPPSNVSSVNPDLATWPSDLAERVRYSEREAIRRFGYGERPYPN